MRFDHEYGIKNFDIIPDGETDLKFRMRRNYACSKSH